MSLRRLPILIPLLALALGAIAAPAEANSLDNLDELRTLDQRLTDRIKRAKDSARRAEDAARGMPDIRKLEAAVRKAIYDARPTHCKHAQDAIDVLEKSYAKGKDDVAKFEAGVKRVNEASRALKTEADRANVKRGYARVDEIHAKIVKSVARAKANFEAYERAQERSDREFLAAADRMIADLEAQVAKVGAAHRLFQKHRLAVDARRKDVRELGREMRKVRAAIKNADLSEAQRREVDVIMAGASRAPQAMPSTPSLPRGAWYSEKNATAMRANLEYVATYITKRRCVKDIGAYTRIQYLGGRADRAHKGTASGRKRAETWHIWNGKKIKDVLDAIATGGSKGRLKYMISVAMYHNQYIFVDPYGRTVMMSGALRNPRPFDEAEFFKDVERTGTHKSDHEKWSHYETWAPRPGSKRSNFGRWFPRG